MARVIKGTGGIDTREFKAVAKALRKAQPAVYRQMAKNLCAAGKLVANDAKAIVGKHSSSIPPTIKAKQRGTAIAVEAGGGSGGKKLAGEIQGASYGTSGVGGANRKLAGLMKQAEGNALAGLYELGNKGGSKSASATSRGVFRHPVFGDRDNWVEQPRYAYLAPAGEKNRPAIEAAVGAALDEVTSIIVLED
jgi:hypothetical protein